LPADLNVSDAGLQRVYADANYHVYRLPGAVEVR
jgi:hypothetical protein